MVARNPVTEEEFPVCRGRASGLAQIKERKMNWTLKTKIAVGGVVAALIAIGADHLELRSIRTRKECK